MSYKQVGLTPSGTAT